MPFFISTPLLAAYLIAFNAGFEISQANLLKPNDCFLLLAPDGKLLREKTGELRRFKVKETSFSFVWFLDLHKEEKKERPGILYSSAIKIPCQDFK